MICDDCYHHSDCEKKPDESGRCSSYLKDSKVVIDDDMEVNPMDTLTFDYDDIKRMLEEVDKEKKQKKLQII